MSEPAFLPDNFLNRLEKKLTGGALKKEIGALSRDFGDLTFLTKHYQQPHGQLKKPIEGKEGDTRPVFGTLNRFLGRPIEQSLRHHHRNALFLLGDAGLGKTSLLMLLKAAHLTGLANCASACELRRLCETTLDDLRAIKSPRRTILLLDALNEDPKASGDLLKYATELLETTRHFHRVIITCRTAYFCERRDPTHAVGAFVSGAFRCATLYLTPFNQALTDKYLNRRFQRMKEPNRQKVSKRLHDLGAFRDRPLLFNHADDVVQVSEKTWNAGAAYEAIVGSWLERESRSSKLSKDALWESCTRLAHRCQQSPSRHRTNELKELDEIHKLDCQGRSLLRKVAGKDYRFTHISFQEYLIARGLTHGVIPSGKQRLSATELIVTFLIESDHAATAWRTLDLTGMSFHKVQLRGANFSRSLLERADFSDSTLHSPSFDQAILTAWEAPRASFNNAHFQGAKATFSDLRGARFSGTSFANSTLAESTLADVHMEDCQWNHTLMAETDLSGAHLSKSTIEDCSFKHALLDRAHFQNTTLTKVRFDHAQLTRARFENATYDNMSLESADLRGAELDAGFFAAIKSGAITHWKKATWDPAVAKRFKL